MKFSIYRTLHNNNYVDISGVNLAEMFGRVWQQVWFARLGLAHAFLLAVPTPVIRSNVRHSSYLKQKRHLLRKRFVSDWLKNLL